MLGHDARPRDLRRFRRRAGARRRDGQRQHDERCAHRRPVLTAEALEYANGTAEPGCDANAADGVRHDRRAGGCSKLKMRAGALGTPSTTPVVIDGAGPGPAACTGTGTVIDAQQQSRVLDDGDESTATIDGVTITGGLAGNCGGDGCGGGGIFMSGSLTLDDVVVTGNAAGNANDGGLGGDGGGINDFGNALTIENSTISDNTAGMGASATVKNESGGAGGLGGGIYNEGGTVDIVDSTITGNSAGQGGAATTSPATLPGQGGYGGGVSADVGISSGSISMTNVTMYGNVAGPGGAAAGGGSAGTGGVGGAVYGGSAPVSLDADTIVGNDAAQGSAIYADDATETASIIANNGGSDPCDSNASSGPADEHDNIVDPSGSHCPGTVANPNLGPLQSDGGPVQTMALLAGSPAIETVPVGPKCPQTDARGVARPQLFACDSGAYEWAPPALSGTSAAATSPSTAQVRATVDPNLQATSVLVDYGPTSSYGSHTTAVSAGSGNAPVPVSVPLTALTPTRPTKPRSSRRTPTGRRRVRTSASRPRIRRRRSRACASRPAAGAWAPRSRALAPHDIPSARRSDSR